MSRVASPEYSVNNSQVTDVGKMYMQPNLYLVPQPGSIFKSETEALIKESPHRVLSRKISMADYKD